MTDVGPEDTRDGQRNGRDVPERHKPVELRASGLARPPPSMRRESDTLAQRYDSDTYVHLKSVPCPSTYPSPPRLLVVPFVLLACARGNELSDVKPSQCDSPSVSISDTGGATVPTSDASGSRSSPSSRSKLTIDVDTVDAELRTRSGMGEGRYVCAGPALRRLALVLAYAVELRRTAFAGGSETSVDMSETDMATELVWVWERVAPETELTA